MYRYERKYILPDYLLAEVVMRLKLHGFVFSQAYPPRYVNSLYFDHPAREQYLDSVDGVAQRRKVRIRWYGDLWGRITEPTLELKIKQGLMGAKRRLRLAAFEFASHTRRTDMIHLLTQVRDPAFMAELQALEPVRLVRYRRQYYQSFDKQIRLTLDNQVEYLRPPHGSCVPLAPWRDDRHAIVELKYPAVDNKRAQGLAQFLRLSLSRNSKYRNAAERA